MTHTKQIAKKCHNNNLNILNFNTESKIKLIKSASSLSVQTMHCSKVLQIQVPLNKDLIVHIHVCMYERGDGDRGDAESFQLLGLVARPLLAPRSIGAGSFMPLRSVQV